MAKHEKSQKPQKDKNPSPDPKLVEQPTNPPKKKWWKNWQARLASVIVILTLFTMLLDLPKKGKEAWHELFGKPAITTPLKGIVTDTLNNMPIESAVVKLDKLPGDSVITTSDGSFKFNKVPGKAGDDVRIYVYANGYNPRNEYKALPGPVDIKLRKNK